MARTPRARRSEPAEARRIRLLEGLLDLDRTAFYQPELQVCLEGLLTRVLDILKLGAGTIRLVEGSGEFEIKAHRGLSPFYLNAVNRVPFIAGHPVFSPSQESLLVPDIAQDPRFANSLFQQEGLKSLLLMPIRAENRVIGAVTLMSFREERTLGEEDRSFLEQAGERIGQAILYSRRYEETKRQQRSLALLFSVSQAVGQTLALGEMLARALEAQREGLGCLFAAAYLTKENGPSHPLDLAQSRGVVTIPPGLWEAMENEASTVHARIQTALAGEIAEVPDLAQEYFEGSTLLWGQGVRSLTLIPVRKQAGLIGVILLGGKARLLNEKWNADFLATVGAQFAIGIENAWLYRKAEQRASDLTALQMIGLEVGSTLSQRRVMELIVETVDELLRAHNVSLMLREEGTDVLTTLAYRGQDPDPSAWEQTFRLSDPKGVMAWVARTGEPAVIPDVSADSRYFAWFPEVRSEIAVPIFAQGRVLGVLNVESEREGAFGDHELRLLKALAGQAAIALANARLFEQAQHRIAELTALQKISTSLGSAADEQHVAQVVVETVEELLGTHHVSLLTRVPGTDRFRVLAISARAASAPVDFTETRATSEVGVIAWVARNGKPLIVNDTRREPRYREKFPGILSEITVPVLSRGEVLGVINVESERVNAFDDHTLRILSIVANQAEAALENSRLFGQARRKIANLTALHEIGLEITSTLAVELILERIVDIVVGSLKPFDCAFYSLTEAEPRELAIGPSFPGENGRPLPSAPDVRRISLAGSGVIAWVAREGRSAFLPRVQEDPRYIKVFEQVVSEIAVPLLAKGKVMGVLNVETDRGEAFTESTLEFLTTIAQQASVAIENARLYELLEQNYFDTVRTLVLAMDAKDPYTRGHSERVRRYSVELAAALGMDEEETKRVSYAGLLHDIGKIGVREDILLKPGELTPEEFEEVKLHSVVGGKLVDNVAQLKGVGPLIRSEHENFAGGGYPDNLVGEQIPLGARVIAVADAYDAMTTDRAYHQAMPPGDALKELRACAGKQFDPRVVEALVHIVTGKRE